MRDLAPQDWLEIGSVKLTTPLRTALDLGCGLNRREALGAMDALARAHGLLTRSSPSSCHGSVGAAASSSCASWFRWCVVEAESMRESWTRLAIHDFGLPEPTLQWWVDVDGVPTYRLDLAYPRARIAIEYDGRDHHTSAADRARDEARRAWLRAHGWTVIVVDASDFAPGADDAWLCAVRDALAVAQQRPRRIYARR